MQIDLTDASRQIDLTDASSQNISLSFLRHPIARIHATNTDNNR